MHASCHSSTTAPTAPSPAWPSKTAGLLGALLLLDLLLRLGVVFRPLPVIDALTLPDDAYLSLQIARNIARGLGPLYGNGYTNGYQPLYVLLMVPIYRLFTADPILPIKIALTLSAFFDVLTLAVLWRLAGRLTGSSRAALVVAAAWIFNGYVIQTTLNGLETGISFFFIVASFNAVYTLIDGDESAGGGGFNADSAGIDASPGLPTDAQVGRPEGTQIDGRHPGTLRRFLPLGLLLGLAVLSRIDNLILATAVGGMLLAHLIRQGWRPAAISRILATLGAGMAVVNLPWLAWSYAYTGLLFPISGRAVRFMSLANVKHQPTWHNMYWPMLKKALLTVGYRNGLVFDALGVAVLVGVALVVQARLSRASSSAPTRFTSLGGPVPRSAPTRLTSLDWPVLSSAATRLAGPVIYGLMMIGAYAFYIFTPWFFDRYLFPLLAPLLMILAVTIELVARALEQAAALSGGTGEFSPPRALGIEHEHGDVPCPSPPRARALGLTRPTLVLLGGLVVLLAGAGVSTPRFWNLYAPLEPENRGGYLGIGLWAKEHLPVGTIVGSSQTGALAYFAEKLEVINLDGVVNEPCYQSLVEGRNMDYIRRAGIQYVLGWQINIEFIKKHSSHWRPGDLALVQQIEEVRSWGKEWYLYRVR